MIFFKNLFITSLITLSVMFVQPAKALIVGEAVDAIGSTNVAVGNLATRTVLPGGTNNAIEYFIPLGNGDGIYGVDNGGDFGTVFDLGNGGGILTMFLRFGSLAINNGVLSILFEDLDIAPNNDPSGFFETVRVFDNLGDPLTNLITSESDPTISNISSNTLELTLALGPIAIPTFFVELNFAASFTGNGKNTAEYLRATFAEGNETISVIPLPAALPLYGTGLAVIGFIGWRRRRKATA